jgi:hypothetical protein
MFYIDSGVERGTCRAGVNGRPEGNAAGSTVTRRLPR